MTLATVTSKGQITIPKPVRLGLGISAGDQVEFVQISENRYEIVAATRDVTGLKGLVGKARRRVSLEEMNQAIEKMGR